MRTLLLSSLFVLASSSYAAVEGWQVIAESSKDCPEKVQILGKEGEKYVRALYDGKDQKLVSKNKEAFSTDAKREMTFETTKEESKNETVKFTNPGMIESNVPKVEVVKNGKTHNCNMQVQ
jgi:hypothetical protein